MDCACGVPSKANYYLFVIHGRDIPGGTETDYTDGYYCDAHKPKPKDVVPTGSKVLEWSRKRLR